jgi:hypothetical protein
MDMDTDPAHLDLLCDSISEQLVSILTSEIFRNWLSQERVRGGDLLILNSSFLHREGIANRSKNIQYLSVTVEPDSEPSIDASVLVSKKRILSRFKRVAETRSGDYPSRPMLTT